MKRRLLPILSILLSLVIASSCGYAAPDTSSADASTQDAIAAIAYVEEITDSSEAILLEEPSSSEELSSSELPSSSDVSSSKAASSLEASSKAKYTTVTADNDYSIVTDSNPPQPDDENAENKSYTVYITDTGNKYHRSGCRYLNQSKYAISREDAREQGYTPCTVCKPG